MKSWPVPYEDTFIDSEYGKIHVIASGPVKAPPLLLLHASGVAGWSWKYNIMGLSRNYRCYAIDLIGDVGKSEFKDMKKVLKTGEDQAKLYAHISKKLGADSAFVAGASEGGFIATNYAFYYPERVRKLVLLGPMGYSGAMGAVLRIMFAQFFPLESVQESTFSWAFSDNPKLKSEFSEWFPLVMTGYNPVKVSPLPFPAAVRQQLKVPVLFIFGKKDNLVGDPEAARDLVRDIPSVKVEIVDAGHLMAAEIPEEVNGLILNFFSK
jgi:pimeloyl-ACP methyl ester carboxylesterase